DAYPDHGLYATEACRPDMIFADPYRIPIKTEALRPTVLHVQIGLKDWQHNLELAPSAGGKQIPALLFTAGKLAPGPLDPPASSQNHWRLGDQIELIAGLVPDQIRAGENLSIKLYWQALSTITESYTVFVHVQDTQGHTVAQADGQPVNADYPTDWWSGGEMIEDEHQIALPSKLPASQYRIAIGLYRLADLSRLPVTDATGQLQPDDQIILPGPLQVRP
ncbi:MAG TPA: hypothetical protein VFK30_15640, partial [Anaerolineae bacterium]|nr:hypothetical protein [Anaerolineae bacterium]